MTNGYYLYYYYKLYKIILFNKVTVTVVIYSNAPTIKRSNVVLRDPAIQKALLIVEVDSSNGLTENLVTEVYKDMELRIPPQWSK